MAGGTHAFLVPAVVAWRWPAGPEAMALFGRLKAVGYGAAPMPLPVLRAAMEAWPDTTFQQVYGMTEFGGVITMLDDDAHRDAEHPERLVSAGVPVPDAEMRIVDPSTLRGRARRVSRARSGSARRRPTIGYLGKPEATAELITEDGWVRTGDLGRVDDDGFLFIEDRIKDMIITGGENVYSPEVERVLAEHPAVAEIAIIGVPDDRWGETVKAVVAFRPGAGGDRGRADRVRPRAAGRLQGAVVDRRRRGPAAQPVGQDPQARPAQAVLAGGGPPGLTFSNDESLDIAVVGATALSRLSSCRRSRHRGSGATATPGPRQRTTS